MANFNLTPEMEQRNNFSKAKIGRRHDQVDTFLFKSLQGSCISTIKNWAEIIFSN